MLKWRPTSEEPAKLNAGDRILLAVKERPYAEARFLTYRIVILEATEDGWYSADETYSGYSLGDGEYWCYEHELLLASPNIIPTAEGTKNV